MQVFTVQQSVGLTTELKAGRKDRIGFKIDTIQGKSQYRRSFILGQKHQSSHNRLHIYSNGKPTKNYDKYLSIFQ